MEVFRLVREKYSDKLTGKGAALNGARWNSAGVEIIYTASNRSLAMAEVIVHVDLLTLADDYHMVTIHIPDDVSFKKLTPADLPENWNAFPNPVTTQLIGDRFVNEKQYCVLMIPSSVTHGDYNLLINPNHPDFAGIKIINVEKFPFDKRIFK
jgi:RES domain-containing protein